MTPFLSVGRGNEALKNSVGRGPRRAELSSSGGNLQPGGAHFVLDVQIFCAPPSSVAKTPSSATHHRHHLLSTDHNPRHDDGEHTDTMVDNHKKRKLPTGSAAVSAKKRRKGPATKKAAGPTAVAKPKKVLDANCLPWKTVDIPEMFDDAEGFFGLEEVTGVEVVRNGNTLKFVSTLPIMAPGAPG